MWERLCSFHNAPPVRIVTAEISDAQVRYFEIKHVSNGLTNKIDFALLARDSYPVDQPIGDQLGRVTVGIQPDNSDPWCLQRPAIASDLAAVERYWREPLGKPDPIPFCPDGLQRLDEAAVKRWSMRGAMNAGLSVFLYLDALAKGEVTRPIPYDRCEDLVNGR